MGLKGRQGSLGGKEGAGVKMRKIEARRGDDAMGEAIIRRFRKNVQD